MRLLKVENAGVLSLAEFIGGDEATPPYAILSHTWGANDQEVTFQDLIQGSRKKKAGYAKLEFCRERAVHDGLLYFWVDTCCIDKSNFTELSEAINSMFRWYQNAAKCYVYLSDVSMREPAPNTQLNQTTWESEFENSRWFTRGWTLQELIAPRSVEFYSREGKRLGDKKSLEQEIVRTAGIAAGALQGKPLSTFSNETRVSWAIGRETEREEDIAYALLGIFQAHMPLIYGEGRNNALARLQKEVKCSLSILSRQDPHWIVPFERNSRFIGNEHLLARLEELVFSEDSKNNVAITGLGGTGKTQLALEFVYQIREKHKKWSVFWIIARDRESLHKSYVVIAQQLGITGLEDYEVDVKRYVQRYLSTKYAGQWLLVFDDANDFNPLFSKSELELNSEKSSDYFPRKNRRCIIFTTRNRKTAVKLAPQNVLAVPAMSEDVAFELLRTCLINQELIKDRSSTIILLEKLTYLPLAIVQAASYINANDIGLASYLSLLTNQEEDAMSLLSEDFEQDGRYSNAQNSTIETYLISFEQIRHRDPLAAVCLSLAACIAPRSIPESFFQLGKSRKIDDAIGTLEAYFFINRRTEDQALELHHLIHLATRNWLQKNHSIIQWSEKAIEQLEEIFPDPDYANRNVWKIYLPHVQYALRSGYVDKYGEKKIELTRKYGTCLYDDGRFRQAEESFKELIEPQTRVLGAKHPNTLGSIAILAAILHRRGKLEEAKKLTVQIIESQKKVLGAEHHNTLFSMAILAAIYHRQGRLKEAEELTIQVIEPQNKILGSEHPDTLGSIAILTAIYYHQGRLKEAEELTIQIIESQNKLLGAEHRNTLFSMAILAAIYLNQGRLKEAEELTVQIIESQKKVLGEEHPNTLRSMAILTAIYYRQGRLKEAERLAIQVIEPQNKVLGAEHPDTLGSIAIFTAIYYRQGRLKEAEELTIQVIEPQKKVLGAEHPDTLGSIANLAVIYQNQMKSLLAKDLAAQVVEIRQRVMGGENLDLTTSINDLASTFSNQAKWEKAERLGRLVTETKSRAFGAEHLETLTGKADLALIYKMQGRWEEAEDLEVHMKDLSLKALGIEHPFTSSIITDLSLTYRSQGNWRELEVLDLELAELRNSLSVDTDSDDVSDVSEISSTLSAASTSESKASVGMTEDASKKRLEYFAQGLINDIDLRTLYSTAIIKFGKEKFARNHNRLLKRFFMNIRRETESDFQRQIIRIFRSPSQRKETTDLICQALNPFIYARGTAAQSVLDIKLDFQRTYIERLIFRILGPHVLNQFTSKATASGLSFKQEQSNDAKKSTSEAIDDIGTKSLEEKEFHQLDLTLAFLTRGMSFDQFKADLRRFVYPPTTLEEAVRSHDSRAVRKLLEKQFNLVATGEYLWLRELDEVGYTRHEMAEIIFEDANDAPWIYFEPQNNDHQDIQTGVHMPECVHRFCSGDLPLFDQSLVRSQHADPYDDEEVRRLVQEHCGLAGVAPVSRNLEKWNGCVGFEEENSIAVVSYTLLEGKENMDRPALVYRISNALNNFCTAVSFVQANSLCCDSFTVLRCTSNDSSSEKGSPDQVELRRVELTLAMQLLEEVRHLSILDQITPREALQAQKISTQILWPFNLATEPSQDMDIVDFILHLCSLAVQFLSLGFLSYIQAHIGALQPFFLDSPQRKILLLGTQLSKECSNGVKAELIELTCLGSMTQGPVLAFDKIQNNTNSLPSENPPRYDVVSSAEDLLDTWGPGHFITRKDCVGTPCAVSIGDGIIYGKDPDGNAFHWSNCVGLDGPFPVDFDPRAKIIIGALVTVNTNCFMDVRKCWLNSCTALETLGTASSMWEPKEKQSGIQIGQYGYAQLNKTWYKYQGKTLKQCKLEQEDDLLLPFLEATWGLQVSFCTSIARRVQLRELVADMLPSFANTMLSQSSLWEDLTTNHNIIDAFQSNNLRNWLANLAPELQKYVLKLIRRILVILKYTGVDRDGKHLTVAWPQEDDIHRCLKIPCKKQSLWAPILADSEDCATFAYISSKCLESGKVKCNGPSPVWQNVTTLLETAVIRHQSIPTTVVCNLEHKKTYFIKKLDSLFLVKVHKPDKMCSARLIASNSTIKSSLQKRLFKREEWKRQCRLRERQAVHEPAEHVIVLALKSLLDDEQENSSEN